MICKVFNCEMMHVYTRERLRWRESREATPNGVWQSHNPFSSISPCCQDFGHMPTCTQHAFQIGGTGIPTTVSMLDLGPNKSTGSTQIVCKCLLFQKYFIVLTWVSCFHSDIFPSSILSLILTCFKFYFVFRFLLLNMYTCWKETERQ